MPVFEGLLPDNHNEITLDLLFVLATWHALAKLRMHTETTLQALEETTDTLGHQVRLFKKAMSVYDTRELKKEIIAQGRRRAALRKNKGKAVEVNLEVKRKDLNINTPKFHALGGYVEAIRRFGTTDSFSTQIVSLSDV